ncbi:MAG: ABC transporter ATP-binding protein [Candidatus Wallbacteria bacterium]|nr:ABC transporter ATP-binding protein [Candidatus Wallbacteria bacterium]MBI4869045.1 ABC transporter ATP-binding protein [Candidatus Wallbacteria bacterium]
MGEAIIDLRQVKRCYRRGSETVSALDGFDLQVPTGAFHAIMGPSGSGKSTLLNLLGGLDKPDSGTVQVDGKDLATMSPAQLSRFRADTIGFIFQGFNLISVLTALQNVELPLLLLPLTKARRREQALRALKLVNMEDRRDHRPSQLSGGQEQRVAIARAVAMDPKVILADEPTGDLDRVSADAVLDILVQLNREFGKTILMVTHDPRAAERAGAIVHLDKGQVDRIVPQGPGPKD